MGKCTCGMRERTDGNVRRVHKTRGAGDHPPSIVHETRGAGDHPPSIVHETRGAANRPFTVIPGMLGDCRKSANRTLRYALWLVVLPFFFFSFRSLCRHWRVATSSPSCEAVSFFSCLFFISQHSRVSFPSEEGDAPPARAPRFLAVSWDRRQSLPPFFSFPHSLSLDFFSPFVSLRVHSLRWTRDGRTL